MSLLADLLAKIKQPPSQREVPPNLRNIVQSSAKQSGNRRKIILLGCIFAAAVVSGLLLTYFGRSLMEPEHTVTIPAGNVAAQADIETLQKSEAHDAAGKPQGAGLAVETPVQSDAEMTDAGNPVTDEPVTAPEPVAEKTAPEPVRKKKVPKSHPSDQAASAGKAGELPSGRQETAAKRDAFLYAARKYEMNNDYLNALSNYKSALKSDTNNVTVMNNIAFMYLKLNLPDEAVAYAQMALDRDRDYVPALINMAIASAQSGKFVDAEHYLNQAGGLDPDNETIILNLAVLYERKENFPKALDLYSRLVKLGKSEGRMGEARIYEKQGNMQKAIELYKGISISDSVENAVKIKARERLIILLNKR